MSMYRILKLGGFLFLKDVIFRFVPDYHSQMKRLLNEISECHTDEFMEEMKTHIREEYSTYNWIMEGLIARAGFTILSAENTPKLFSIYHCRKN